MNDKHDIQSREDIATLVAAFYAKATPDPIIGKFFTEVVQLSWEKHIPLIVDFWSGLLLGIGNYKGNVMQAHMKLNALEPIQSIHFERWVELWTHTIDGLYSGAKATEAKERGASVAQFMMYKLTSA